MGTTTQLLNNRKKIWRIEKFSLSLSMKKYIVTFGFHSDDEGYITTNSKPITAKNPEEAEIKLKDQFESYEGVSCEIIAVKEA